MNFKAQLQDYASFTDMKLDFYLPPLDNDQKSIYEAMRYSLLCGGKRIRPVLAYSTAALLGISKEDVAPFACAIEMIHTYSLIHDDLPAMDNDDYRRGQLTCHKKFGEAQAILAGDALLTKAFEIAGIGAIELANKMPEQAVRGALILRALAASAGSEGMVGGQVIDLEGEEKVLSKETHETLCALKTGALLTIPVQISVLYAGMTNTPVGDLLIRYAQGLGLAFQIKDDILDVEGDAKLLGKATGMDEKCNKTTFVSLYGLEGAKARLKALTEESLEICDQLSDIFPERTEQCAFLRELAIFLLERNH
ncbi:MAG: polyprenyl synthetase family protein [Clostridia bacterium]|nr:polyprenyl synthetase family protein [Clostridia bacterium]